MDDFIKAVKALGKACGGFGSAAFLAAARQEAAMREVKEAFSATKSAPSELVGRKAHTIIVDEWPPEVPRLFPEEDVAFRAARKLFRSGPNAVIIDIQGSTRHWGAIPNVEDDISVALYGQCPVVYIREDGWMLAAPRKWAEVAREMWSDTWVGVIEMALSKKHNLVLSELTIFPDNAPQYVAAILGPEGTTFDVDGMSAAEQEEAIKVGIDPQSVDDLRDWMRAGCGVKK